MSERPPGIFSEEKELELTTDQFVSEVEKVIEIKDPHSLVLGPHIYSVLVTNDAQISPSYIYHKELYNLEPERREQTIKVMARPGVALDVSYRRGMEHSTEHKLVRIIDHP